jgi:hypothetical protein
MSLNNWLVLDVASAPIPDAANYIEPVSAPSNYRDPDKIAAYVAEKTAERIAGVALDLDLARLTAVGWLSSDDGVAKVFLAKDGDDIALISALSAQCRDTRIITYGGFRFDLPLIMRRARYLGVEFPKINIDKYRSQHVDLCDLLSDHDYTRRRPLGFYVRRLGWTDLTKPLSGEEESRVLESGRWDDLLLSVRHDVIAIHRLAEWCGVIPKAKTLPLLEPAL